MTPDDHSRYTDRLREAADLLEAQGANPFRVSAYRKAADTVRDLGEDVATIVAHDGAAAGEPLPDLDAQDAPQSPHQAQTESGASRHSRATTR